MLQTGAGGVASSNNSGIWRETALVVREGSQTPGTPTGALFAGFGNPVLNDSGQVAYSGLLQTGAGGVTSSNNAGIWLNGPNGDTLLVARKGDAFDGKTVSSLDLLTGSGGSDGRIEPIGGEIEFDNLLTNNAGGRVAGRDALLRFDGGLANSGQVQMTFGTSDVFGDIDNQASGVIINSGNGNLTLFDDLDNDGELRTSTGATTVVFGAYTGTGTLTGTGSNFFEGGFSPGASPFLATATTDINFGFSNTTLIELAGTTRGVGTASEYDGLDVLGGKTLSLDGILDVALIEAFTPDAGDAFLLFTAGTIVGDFHTVNLPTLNAGLDWVVSNDGQSYAASVVPLPGAVWLLVSALGGLVVIGRRS